MNRYSILVTGGAGYLGSTLVPALLAEGHRVTVLDNFLFNQASMNSLCADPNFDVYRGDARDRDVLKPLLRDADFIIPLAALVGAPMCNNDKIGAETLNRDAILTLIEMASREQRIIMPVTNSGYGVGEAGKFCTEETPLRPISLYGRTKVAAERAVLDRGNSISFRLATVFGMSPRMRLDLLVNDFVYRAPARLAIPRDSDSAGIHRRIPRLGGAAAGGFRGRNDRPVRLHRPGFAARDVRGVVPAGRHRGGIPRPDTQAPGHH